MKIRFCFRGFSWFKRKEWYAIRRIDSPIYAPNSKFVCLDFGGITVSIETKQ